MKLAIMQPYFFPHLGYFQLIHSCDTFLFYDDVNYIRQGWVNRNRILMNGQPAYFTVPVEDGSSFRSISKTRIDSRRFDRWKGKFLTALNQNYRRSPNCTAVVALVERVLSHGCEFIGDLARVSILEVAGALGLKRNFVFSSSKYNNASLANTTRILDICRRTEASTYINAPGGRDLYQVATFAERGVQLSFLKPNLTPYPQGQESFYPSLSILDVLMFSGVAKTAGVLSDYTLE